MIPFLVVLMAQFPSTSGTNWMEPAAFRLVLGDSRGNIERDFARRGWKLEPGETDGTLLHEYGDGKTVAMEFLDDKLVSVRFELVSFRAQLADDWADAVERLREQFGEPEVDRPALFVARADAVTIHAVLHDQIDSELGRQGVGRIILRYFIPSAAAEPADANR